MSATRLHGARYASRKAPMYHAKAFAGKVKVGNDRRKWRSVKSGRSYRWRRVSSKAKPRITKKKVEITARLHGASYASRKAPMYHAKAFAGKVKVGNDKRKWRSVKAGRFYRWKRVSSSATKKKETKPRSVRPAAAQHDGKTKLTKPRRQAGAPRLDADAHDLQLKIRKGTNGRMWISDWDEVWQRYRWVPRKGWKSQAHGPVQTRPVKQQQPRPVRPAATQRDSTTGLRKPRKQAGEPRLDANDFPMLRRRGTNGRMFISDFDDGWDRYLWVPYKGWEPRR